MTAGRLKIWNDLASAWEYPPGAPSGGSVTSIPLADQAGTTDTTTYDNPVTGSGKIAVAVFPNNTAAWGIAQDGDAFPRYLFVSGEGLYLGDGTFDPYAGGIAISPNTGGLTNGLTLEGGPNTLQIGAGGGSIAGLGTGPFVHANGIGAFGTDPPAVKPAAPVTLGDVIAILQGAGLCA